MAAHLEKIIAYTLEVFSTLDIEKKNLGTHAYVIVSEASVGYSDGKSPDEVAISIVSRIKNAPSSPKASTPATTTMNLGGAPIAGCKSPIPPSIPFSSETSPPLPASFVASKVKTKTKAVPKLTNSVHTSDIVSSCLGGPPPPKEVIVKVSKPTPVDEKLRYMSIEDALAINTAGENFTACLYEMTAGVNKGKVCGAASSGNPASTPIDVRCKACVKKTKENPLNKRLNQKSLNLTPKPAAVVKSVVVKRKTKAAAAKDDDDVRSGGSTGIPSDISGVPDLGDLDDVCLEPSPTETPATPSPTEEQATRAKT